MSITRVPRRSTALLVALGVATLTACAAPPPVPSPATQPLAAPAPLPATAEVWDRMSGWRPLPTVPQAAPVPAWSAPVPVGAQVEVDETGVVVLTEARGPLVRAQRLDTATGSPLWTVDVPGGEPLVSVVGGGSPVVVVWTMSPEDAVTVLDAADGRVLWQAPFPGGVVDATADTLLVRASTTTVAVDRATGAARWEVPLDVTLQDGTYVLESAADVDTLTNTDGVADPATGEAVWQQTNHPVTDVTVIGDLFVRTQDVEPGRDAVAAFDAATGTPLWAADPGALPQLGRGTVAPLGPGVLLVSGGGWPGVGSVAVSAADGAVLWTADGPLSTVVRLDGTLAALRVGGNAVTVVDAATGAVAVDEDLLASLELAGGAVYASADGEVTAHGVADFAELWTVTGVGSIYGVDAVPGGFVATVGETEPRTLTAYLG